MKHMHYKTVKLLYTVLYALAKTKARQGEASTGAAPSYIVVGGIVFVALVNLSLLHKNVTSLLLWDFRVENIFSPRLILSKSMISRNGRTTWSFYLARINSALQKYSKYLSFSCFNSFSSFFLNTRIV